MAVLLAKDAQFGGPTDDHRHLPFSTALFTGVKRSRLLDWHPSMDTALSFNVVTVEPNDPQTSPQGNLDWSLPEEVLVKVFSYLHPTDRIQGASLVCKQWRRLIYTKGIWTEAVIMNLRVENLRSARLFLKKVSQSLTKLYIRKWRDTSSSSVRVHEFFGLLNVLPRKLPNLTFFEFCDFQERFRGNEVNGSLRYPRDFYFINSCMPNLRCLLVHAPVTILNPDKLTSWEVDLSLLGPEVLPHLQSFSLQLQRHVRITRAENFVGGRPSLEGLRLVKCSTARTFARETTFGSTSLRQMSLCAFVTHRGGHGLALPMVAVVPRFAVQNLVFLEIARFILDERGFAVLNALDKLEHLHIRCSCRGLGENAAVNLWWLFDQHFQSTAASSAIPIKYLRISCEEWYFERHPILRVLNNCPELRALNVGRRATRANVVREAAGSLKNLRVLKIDDLMHFLATLRSCTDPNAIFPRLRYVAASNFERSGFIFPSPNDQERFEKNLCRSLFSLRPNLILSVRGNFITYRNVNDHLAVNSPVDEDNQQRIHDAMSADEDLDGLCCVDTTTYDRFSESDDERYATSPVWSETTQEEASEDDEDEGESATD